MSETRIEITGNIVVHHPVKQDATVVEFFRAFDTEVEKAAQRFEQRGEAITFYREIEQRKAA
jgi:hypothetical protein